MALIEQFINKTLALRDVAHAAHWKTESLSQHQALGEFYDELTEQLDGYIESHQGIFGVVGKTEHDGDAKKAIAASMSWITDNREKLSGGVPLLENMLDEICGLHARTLFKLDRLK